MWRNIGQKKGVFNFLLNHRPIQVMSKGPFPFRLCYGIGLGPSSWQATAQGSLDMIRVGAAL